MTSCDKTVSKDSILGKWEVISLYKGKNFEKGNTDYILEFSKNLTVRLNLDVNSCAAEYSGLCDDCISFSAFRCTEICCDNEFSTKLIEVLQEATEYEINSDILTLKNLGEVKLKRVFE